MAFTSVKRQKAYTQIANQIIRSIGQGEFARGERLPTVRELEERFGVSRSTVREALSALELAGIVVIHTGQGAFVANISPDSRGRSRFGLDPEESVAEVLEMRLALEPEAARLATERATEEDIQLLEEALHHLRLAVKERRPVPTSYVQFHLALAKASHNSVIYDIMQGVADYVGRALWAHQDFGPTFLYQHEQIVNSIRRRDGDKVARLIHEHLQRVQQDLLTDV